MEMKEKLAKAKLDASASRLGTVIRKSKMSEIEKAQMFIKGSLAHHNGNRKLVRQYAEDVKKSRKPETDHRENYPVGNFKTLDETLNTFRALLVRNGLFDHATTTNEEEYNDPESMIVFTPLFGIPMTVDDLVDTYQIVMDAHNYVSFQMILTDLTGCYDENDPTEHRGLIILGKEK